MDMVMKDDAVTDVGDVDTDSTPTKITTAFWIAAFRQQKDYPASNENCGKWLVFVPPDRVDDLWSTIKSATEAGRLGGSAKCSTARPNPNAVNDNHVICVYTYDWTDAADAKRIRAELRALGIDWKIPYKADTDTNAGRYRVKGYTRISKYFE